MQVSHSVQNNILIITPEFESLDAKEAPEFKKKVLDLLVDNSHHNSKVILDLHNLQFLDSSGLGAFLSVLRTVNTQGGSLKLVNMNPSIRTIFELVSMHKIFDIHASVAAAAQTFT